MGMQRLHSRNRRSRKLLRIYLSVDFLSTAYRHRALSFSAVTSGLCARAPSADSPCSLNRSPPCQIALQPFEPDVISIQSVSVGQLSHGGGPLAAEAPVPQASLHILANSRPDRGRCEAGLRSPARAAIKCVQKGLTETTTTR